MERDLGGRTTSQDPGSALRRLVFKTKKKTTARLRRNRPTSVGDVAFCFGVIVGRVNFDLLYLKSPLAYCDRYLKKEANSRRGEALRSLYY